MAITQQFVKMMSNTTVVVEAGNSTRYSISRSDEITQPGVYRPLALLNENTLLDTVLTVFVTNSMKKCRN